MCSIAVFSASTWPCTRFSSDHARVLDDALHQQPAKPVPLERGAHDHGELAAFAILVEMQAHDAEHLSGSLLADGDERHGAFVVELGQLARSAASDSSLIAEKKRSRASSRVTCAAKSG